MQSHQVYWRVVAAAVSVLATAPVSADVEILGGSRTVSAHMTGGADDMQSAPGTSGPWTGTATSLAPGPAAARLTSLQISQVDGTGITGGGSITYSRVTLDPTSGIATSVIDYFLRVTEPTTYTLRGDVREGTSGLITLIGSGGAIHTGSALDVSGMLAPGVYEFSTTIQLNAPQTGPGTARWDVAFIVPAPGGASLLVIGGVLAARKRESAVGTARNPTSVAARTSR